MLIQVTIDDNTLAARFFSSLSRAARTQAIREALVLYASSQLSGTESIPLPSPSTSISKTVRREKKRTVVVSPDPVVPIDVPNNVPEPVREEVREKEESGEVAAKLADPDGGDISGLLKEW